jgi:quinate dehydrogenase
MPHVDILSPDAQEIGSINTIIVQEFVSPFTGKPVLLGRNTDWEGIRNPLLLALPEEKQKEELPLKGRWAFIIGGGGTTRAAVYALGRLGIERIWLINRDPTETEEIIKQFPQ